MRWHEPVRAFMEEDKTVMNHSFSPCEKICLFCLLAFAGILSGCSQIVGMPFAGAASEISAVAPAGLTPSVQAVQSSETASPALVFTASPTAVPSNSFPIKQKWVTNLDSEIEALSTNGFQMVFVRTVKKLYALETNTGKVLWSQDLAWQGIPEPPIVMGENIYFADGKFVWAVDQKNGTVKWKQPVSLSVAEVRSASEDFVAVEIEPYLYILDARDGATLWSKADCSFGGIQADIEKESVYVPCTGESTGQIRAFELSTGEKTWEIQTPFKNASVAFQDGNMYYLQDQNTVSAFDLQNRNVLWNNTFDGEGYKNFEVLGEYLFVSGSSRFCVFHLKDGKQIWCTSEVNNPQPPAVLQETLFIFNGRQNMITAYNLASGNKIGELSIRRLKLFAVQKKIMSVSGGFLIFGNSSSVVAYGE